MENNERSTIPKSESDRIKPHRDGSDETRDSRRTKTAREKNPQTDRRTRGRPSNQNDRPQDSGNRRSQANDRSDGGRAVYLFKKTKDGHGNDESAKGGHGNHHDRFDDGQFVDLFRKTKDESLKSGHECNDRIQGGHVAHFFKKTKDDFQHNESSKGGHVRHSNDRPNGGHVIQLFKRVEEEPIDSEEFIKHIHTQNPSDRFQGGHVVPPVKKTEDNLQSTKGNNGRKTNDRRENGHVINIFKRTKDAQGVHETSKGGRGRNSNDRSRGGHRNKRNKEKQANGRKEVPQDGLAKRTKDTEVVIKDGSATTENETWDKAVKTLYVKKKFNVLMVADQIKNDEYDRRFVDTCIVLCQEGHNVTILSTHILTTQCFEIRHYCRKIHEVGKWLPRDLCGAARSFCFYIRSAYLALWAYFNLEPKPDLIFCNCINISAMKLFRWITNCKLLTFFQVFNYNQMPRASSEYNIQPKYNSKLDATFLDEVLCTNLLTKYVFQYTYKADGVPISVLYPTVRKPLVVSIDYTPMVFIPQKSYTFLSFYNLVPSSKFDMAIKAFGIMYGSLEDSIRNKCYLILIGHYRKNKENDKYLQGLKNQILCMNMQDRIFILNNVQHGLMRNLMNLCHAYIHAQSYAVCEDNIIEAMAAGRPIIATNTGFPCEVIKHKETGYLLQQDAELFADAMIDLLVHPEKYKYMCSCVQKVYEQNFSFSYFVKCINRIVNKYDENLINNANSEYKINQDVIDLNNALEEIHRYYTNLPNINVLVTHQELITDRFYTVEKFYEDIPALYP